MRIWLLQLVLQVASAALCDLTASWARLNEQARRGEAVWAGPQPARQLDPRDVLVLLIGALQRNNHPQPHSGSACLLRFSTDDFRLVGSPARRPSPAQLTNFMSMTQYHLLLDPDASFDFPSDCLQLDEEEAFQDMNLYTTDDQETVDAKLGWTLRREVGAEGKAACWLVSDLTWHDFRPRFRPGIGQEEWPRICG